MKSTFENTFLRLINEDITADTSFGEFDDIFDPDNNIYSSDSYAPGDARLPKLLGKLQKRNNEAKGDKKKKKKKKK